MEDEPQPEPQHKGPWEVSPSQDSSQKSPLTDNNVLNDHSQVNARWLLDLDKFNEWMNEEDYELAETDSDVSCIAMCVRKHHLHPCCRCISSQKLMET